MLPSCDTHTELEHSDSYGPQLFSTGHSDKLFWQEPPSGHFTYPFSHTSFSSAHHVSSATQRPSGQR